eukprot:305822-Pleurochrysis_carterae.AAC.1
MPPHKTLHPPFRPLQRAEPVDRLGVDDVQARPLPVPGVVLCRHRVKDGRRPRQRLDARQRYRLSVSGTDALTPSSPPKLEFVVTRGLS